MALSPRDAVTAARSILEGPAQAEKSRLNRIATAMRPRQDGYQVFIPPGSPPQLQMLAQKSQTNYLPLIVKNLRQTMIVEGYRPARSQDNASPWTAWQANRMDARQAGIHHDGLTYGYGYAKVLPGDPQPVITPVSPRRMTAMYADPTDDEWPMMALEVEGRHLRLYDAEQVYYLGNEAPDGLPMELRYIEARGHGLGVCPIVRYRDRMLTDDSEQVGIIEPLIAIQQRIDETVFGLMVTQYFQAFIQRYVIGWTPTDEAEALKARASEMWTFEDQDVKVGQFEQADLTRYLESKDSAVGDMATISQVPKQNLGQGAVANMSAEALAAMEAQKDREVREVETSFGESHEQLFRLVARASGDENAAADVEAQVRWKDATARSLAQTVDALGKMAQMLGVPVEALWERIPDVTDTDIAEWKALRASSDAFANLNALLSEQANGNTG